MKKAAAHHEWSPLKLVMKNIFKNMNLFLYVCYLILILFIQYATM